MPVATLSPWTAVVPATYGCGSLKQFTVAQYERLIADGYFADDERFELLEGYVVKKMSRGTDHDGGIDLFRFAVERRLPLGWWLRIQQGVTLPLSQPEPDFAIVRGSHLSFRARHPLAADFGIIVEVSESSLARDQVDKARIYAHAGIPEYWIVNLIDRRIEVRTSPSGPTDAPEYADERHYLPGDSVPLVLDGVEVARIAVDDLLP